MQRSDNGAAKAVRGSLAMLLAVAGFSLAINLLTNGRYGFHRDELATLDDARHLAWGYVAYPPVTPFFGSLSLRLFGTSLTGFRFFATLADAIAVVLTGLMAREFGGGRGAQLLAATAAVPFSMIAGTLMQYVSFDYLAWVGCSYFLVRLCKTNDPRWWTAIGTSIGFGMLTKYSMLVCAAAIVVAVLFSPLRCHLRTKWLWLGAALSILIFLPNLLWQFNHNFISLDFLRHIHERDVRIGRTKDFLPDQLLLTAFAAPLALLGLCFFFLARTGRQFRPVGWIYVIPFLVFLLARGRSYYLAPAYPVLYAGGSILGEQIVSSWRRPYAIAVRTAAVLAVLANIVIGVAFFVPIAPINSKWATRVLKSNDDLREEIGWEELVQIVAQIRNSLPDNERARSGILAGNYGEAGAINLYGQHYGLPSALCGTNSFWARGYGDPPPETVIAVGLGRQFLERHFESCELAGLITNRFNVSNEETTAHRDIFVCRRLRSSWSEFWKNFRRYG
jgi:4-amino-4-deoxy-L-arabinose transferase-like glycosyltransferase